MIRQIFDSHLCLLPVIINDRYPDIRQVFLSSLSNALSEHGLASVMPDNYFAQCLETIARWKNTYPETYAAYVEYLTQRGTTPASFELALRQYDSEAFSVFSDCHQTILAGSIFHPLYESDIPTLYEQVAHAIEPAGYSGLFVVFDEFGKYLENAVAFQERPHFKVLQDLAELAVRSEDTRILLTCISHKTISSYAEHLGSAIQSSFRTVEGRFSPIYFTGSFEANFTLIAGALGRDAQAYADFCKEHAAERAATISECEALSLFHGYEHTPEEIVDACFPMHPLTAFCLMKMSERVAQNERTLFTFLADPASPLASLVTHHRSGYILATANLVYDWFHLALREEHEDETLRDRVIFTDALLPSLSEDAGKLVKVVVLISLLADPSVSATGNVLLSALQWDEKKYLDVVASLEEAHRIYVRRSDGVVCLTRNSSDSVQKAISEEVALRHDRADLSQLLSSLRTPGFTVPRRYNDRFGMVRYFANVFLTPAKFFAQPSSAFLSEYGAADGYVLFLVGDADPSEVSSHLSKWNTRSVLVLVSPVPLTIGSAIESCAAIHRLMAKTQDDTTRKELAFYLDDLMQVVNTGFSRMFEEKPLCISSDRIIPTASVGSEASRLCETYLYPETPYFNHEMINRHTISGQMRLARSRLMDAVLNRADFVTCFDPKKAEYPIARAVLCHMDEPRIQAVMQVIERFLSSCEGQAQPLSALYNSLTASPYGLREGVLCILLAFAVRDFKDRITVMAKGTELPVSGDTFGAFDTNPMQYSLLIDPPDADHTTYLQILHDAYASDAPGLNLRQIHDAMSNRLRNLPRSARACRMTLTEDGNTYVPLELPQTLISMRSLLLQYTENARNVLLEKVPASLGLHAGADCAAAIIRNMDFLSSYLQDQLRALRALLMERLGSPDAPSLRSAMTTWGEKQDLHVRQRAHDATTTALMSIIYSKEKHTDEEWLNLCLEAVTGLSPEDWSDTQLCAFPSALDTALSSLEHSPAFTSQSGDANLVLSLQGRTLSESIPDKELEGLSQIAYHALRSTLDDYADAFSSGEKLQILANLMLHMNERS